jgi:hypothetical protein
MSPRERTRRLRKVLAKIEHWQLSNRKAARCHRNRRLRRLHELGIYVSRLRNCFNVF